MWEDVRRCEKMWEDVRRCEKMWEDVKMRRCEDEKMWEDVKMRRCEDEKMWRWEDVKMRRCEDEKMWRWEDEEKMRRWGEDVRMRRCEYEKMWRWEDVKMRRCEDEKMFYRPPLLEEPCAQTLSGKMLELFSEKKQSRTVPNQHGSCQIQDWKTRFLWKRVFIRVSMFIRMFFISGFPLFPLLVDAPRFSDRPGTSDSRCWIEIPVQYGNIYSQGGPPPGVFVGL